MTATGFTTSAFAAAATADARTNAASVASAFELLHQREDAPWLFGERGAELVRHEWIAATAMQAAPAATLDVGCTVGQLTALLTRVLPNVTAIDISPTAVREAQRRMMRVAKFSTGSATSLPFCSASFDLIVAADGLYSWNLTEDDRRIALEELHRVVVPGGYVILTEHTRKARFPAFIGEVAASPLQIVQVTYMYDRLWYQFESWFRAIQHWHIVRVIRRSRRIARLLNRVGRWFGPSASRHVCVVAQRPFPAGAPASSEGVRHE